MVIVFDPKLQLWNQALGGIVFISVVADLICTGLAVQTLVEGPSDTSVNLDTPSVTLKCIVEERSGDLFWRFGREIIPGAVSDRSLPVYPRYSIVGDPTREYNLQITNVQLEDDGVYECQVTPGSNNEQSLLSTPARLTVRRPPVSLTIADVPMKTVSVTVPTNLSCNALSANPAVSLSWFRDGELIEDAMVSVSPSSDPSGKLWDTTSFLKVVPALEDKGATYECRAINAAISEPMVQSIMLDVQHPPVILVETIPEALREGSIVFVQCVVDANPKAVFYLWNKNGEPIPGDTNQIEMELEKSDNQAVVTCAASNAIGTSEGTLTLDVKYGPRFVDIPGETSVDEGELAQLQCSADGNPPATIKWTRIGSRATLSTMQRLQFDSVQESDVGVYICEATVEGFEPVTSYGRVDINTIPEIQYEDIQLARLGSTVRLECLTESKPEPEEIIWSWSDTEMDEGTSGRFSVSQEERDTGYAGVLTIRKVQPSDFTEYNCTVINAKGAAEAIIVLEQQGLDFFFYIIFLVVSMALLIFIISILFLAYCRRKLKARSSSSSTSSGEEEEEKKVKVEIIRKLSDLHLTEEERRKLAEAHESKRPSSRGTPSPPRYADPVGYVPGRRDSWDDPAYRPLSANSRTPPPYRDEDEMSRRYSRRSSHEYMEPGDSPYKGRKTSRGSILDDQYDGSITNPPSRRSPSERDSYTLSSQYGNNRGYGYYPEPNRISISANQPTSLYPDETEKLVRRDDPSRASTLSANTRNRLSTNV